MRRGAVVPRRAALVALLTLLGQAAPGRGGDPIPDVDVILEQLLGVVDGGRLVIAVEGAEFDEIVLSGARRRAGR
ncbi:MAG: hypothetical protein IPJ17_02560 [Holophagales bacterium]|nr:MAG: hypothetical protein IPJ17_02560 [Holophagales bacterium]